MAAPTAKKVIRYQNCVVIDPATSQRAAAPHWTISIVMRRPSYRFYALPVDSISSLVITACRRFTIRMLLAFSVISGEGPPGSTSTALSKKGFRFIRSLTSLGDTGTGM